MVRPSKAEIAYEALRQAIIEQALVPGTKLREDEIGKHFGISRTLVRSALMQLSYEGLVNIKLKRTATVAEPSVDEAKAIFDVRRCLERQVAGLLVENWTDEIEATLEAHIHEEERAAHDGAAATASRLAGEFHEEMARLTGNPVLERYVSELVSRCSLIMALHGRPHQSECSTGEHHQLVEALRGGNAEAASRLMEEHLVAVQARALPGGAESGEQDIASILIRYARKGADPASTPQKRPALRKP